MSFSITKTTLDKIDSKDELLQSGFWANLKCLHGWSAYPFTIRTNDEECSLLVLVKRLASGFSLAYIPMGPLLPEPPEEKETFLESLGFALRKELPKDVAFLRFDLPWHTYGSENFPRALRQGARLKKSLSDVQPPNTVILDISGGEEEILSGMKHKTRYNIRLAEKKGVSVSVGNIDDLDKWYSLYCETAKRDRIAIHSLDYYGSVLRLGRANNSVQTELLLARVEGVVVAGIIIAVKAKRCTYLYGASSNEMRNYMPNHALQWRAIRLARERGCETYDFFGIPAKDDPGHPMSGLYRFKTGFGGRIVNRYGCYDVPYKPVSYGLYSIAESLRMFYYKTLKKRM